MIWMPQIFPCVCAELQQNDLAKHGRERLLLHLNNLSVVVWQCAWRSRCYTYSQDKELSFWPQRAYLSADRRLICNRTGVCEQQSLCPPHLPVTRLVPHLSRCQGGPAGGKHSQQQKKHCCETTRGKRSRTWPHSLRQSSGSQDTFLILEGNLSRALCPKSM